MVVGSWVLESGTARMTSSTMTGSAELDERRLIAAARAGDQNAYAELLRRHQAVVFRAAYLITGSEAEAEDATQEASVKAWRALDRFRPGAPFRPWLIRIAINEARNRRRSAGRHAGLILRVSADRTGAGSAPSAETEAMAADERARLTSAIGRLREDDQLVIATRYFLGLSEAETASALTIRRGTVKSRLSRALVRLERQLEEMR
jgi:RNA polymerase sigma factor (sigma-70 family)